LRASDVVVPNGASAVRAPTLEARAAIAAVCAALVLPFTSGQPVHVKLLWIAVVLALVGHALLLLGEYKSRQRAGYAGKFAEYVSMTFYRPHLTPSPAMHGYPSTVEAAYDELIEKEMHGNLSDADAERLSSVRDVINQIDRLTLTNDIQTDRLDMIGDELARIRAEIQEYQGNRNPG
jgi:hypothetical protein